MVWLTGNHWKYGLLCQVVGLEKGDLCINTHQSQKEYSSAGMFSVDLRTCHVFALLVTQFFSFSNQAIHPREYTFASGGGDNIKKWALPDGDFMKNLSGRFSVCWHY